MESFAEEGTALACTAREGTRKRTEPHKPQFQTTGLGSGPPIKAGKWGCFFPSPRKSCVAPAHSSSTARNYKRKAAGVSLEPGKRFQGTTGFDNERFWAEGLAGKRELFTCGQPCQLHTALICLSRVTSVGSTTAPWSVKQKISLSRGFFCS